MLTICTFDAQRKMRYNKAAEKNYVVFEKGIVVSAFLHYIYKEGIHNEKGSKFISSVNKKAG